MAFQKIKNYIHTILISEDIAFFLISAHLITSPYGITVYSPPQESYFFLVLLRVLGMVLELIGFTPSPIPPNTHTETI